MEEQLSHNKAGSSARGTSNSNNVGKKQMPSTTEARLSAVDLYFRLVQLLLVRLVGGVLLS